MAPGAAQAVAIPAAEMIGRFRVAEAAAGLAHAVWEELGSVSARITGRCVSRAPETLDLVVAGFNHTSLGDGAVIEAAQGADEAVRAATIANRGFEQAGDLLAAPHGITGMRREEVAAMLDGIDVAAAAAHQGRVALGDTVAGIPADAFEVARRAAAMRGHERRPLVFALTQSAAAVGHSTSPSGLTDAMQRFGRWFAEHNRVGG